MQQPVMIKSDFNPDLNPYVGKMANRLVRSFASGEDGDRWALITEILGFAAEAEQKLSEQMIRIKQLENLASTDELTGVANRRGFDDFMARTLALCRRHEQEGVLAYLDIDDFKLVNDNFGHDTGDLMLVKVARILSDNVRSSDFVARLGGDEFAIVLTHCDEANGAKRIEKVLNKVRSSPIHCHGRRIFTRLSSGVVGFHGEKTLRRILDEADHRMYADKKAARIAMRG